MQVWAPAQVPFLNAVSTYQALLWQYIRDIAGGRGAVHSCGSSEQSLAACNLYGNFYLRARRMFTTLLRKVNFMSENHICNSGIGIEVAINPGLH